MKTTRTSFHVYDEEPEPEYEVPYVPGEETERICSYQSADGRMVEVRVRIRRTWLERRPAER